MFAPDEDEAEIDRLVNEGGKCLTGPEPPSPLLATVEWEMIAPESSARG